MRFYSQSLCALPTCGSLTWSATTQRNRLHLCRHEMCVCVAWCMHRATHTHTKRTADYGHVREWWACPKRTYGSVRQHERARAHSQRNAMRMCCMLSRVRVRVRSIRSNKGRDRNDDSVCVCVCFIYTPMHTTTHIDCVVVGACFFCLCAYIWAAISQIKMDFLRHACWALWWVRYHGYNERERERGTKRIENETHIDVLVMCENKKEGRCYA